ncbi:helix-turn-helix transcriptional regulator [Streptomyces sp. SRF1]|uniref:helix-turn-helix domain-containing protein n=1 Tax=Streptomyces sp. SRF1 TaxID=1549642 RepID=UPI0025AF5138|nr:helix-turn-helix transcriptional regulator [Streptomyces sp. SRF1]MDN3060060.1 helix-turn-helix transcriptional regulator [Streptomyces sp. SRF1]
MDARVIGRRIVYWRERRRLTQSGLGALMGKSRRTIQGLELGDRQADPRLSVLEESARAPRIPLEWLLRDGPDTARTTTPGCPCLTASTRALTPNSASANASPTSPSAARPVHRGEPLTGLGT